MPIHKRPLAPTLRLLRRIRLCALLALLPACSDARGGGAPTSVVRDSAGVAIIENSTPAWPDGEGWTLSEEPTLEIGSSEGRDPAYLLDQVTGALRLSDGAIVLANAGSSQLRYYDATGRYLRAAGGPGDGPAEFRHIAWLHRYRGDSLMVYDSWRRGVTVLDGDGAPGRTLAPPAVGAGGRPIPTAPLADGSLLARFTRIIGEPVMGLVPSDASYGVFDGVDGSPVDSVVTLPGADTFLEAVDGGFAVWSPLLATNTYVAVHENEVYAGFSGAQQVLVLGPDGTLRKIIRRVLAPVQVTDAEYDALVEARIDAAAPAGESGGRRERLERAYAKLPVPQTRPAFSALLADRAGNLWMRETALPGEAVRWTVFDAAGSWLGSVEFPEEFTPFEIGDDYVLGVATDELGVQRARMYRLDKAVN